MNILEISARQKGKRLKFINDIILDELFKNNYIYILSDEKFIKIICDLLYIMNIDCNYRKISNDNEGRAFYIDENLNFIKKDVKNNDSIYLIKSYNTNN